MSFVSSRRLLVAAACCALLAGGCSATRGVRPVGEGRWEAGLSIGGPVFTNLGVPIPAPLVSGYGRYGLGERTDLDFGLHLPITGAAGLDIGASHLLLEQDGWRPALMGGGRLLAWGNVLALSGAKDADGRAYDLDFRLFEQLYANASWALGEHVLVWAGLDMFAQIEAAIVHPSLVAGVQWRPVDLFGLTLEAKHLGFFTNQRFAVVEYAGPYDFGAFAVQLGLSFRFGGDK